MLNDTEATQLIGTTAYDTDGTKVGKIGQLFLDDRTGQPEFLTVNTGLFGTSESFVPAQDARREGDRVVLPYSKDKIKDAPKVDLDGDHLDEAEEERLYAYYERSYSTGRTESSDDLATSAGMSADAGVSSGIGTDQGHRSEGYDTSGRTTDDAMTRSEEQVRVGTTEQEAGRVRLRKYVTTETETHTVPVRKERAVLETEPITDANVDAATGGPAISEEEHEVVLHEERPVVEKNVEAVERVRLGTESVTDEETVTEDVRKEHIETDGDIDRR